MTLFAARPLRTAVEARVTALGIPVLTRQDNPPASGRWVIIDGPALFDDEYNDRTLCGEYTLSTADITIMCCGQHTTPAQAAELAAWVHDKVGPAFVNAGPLLPGTNPPHRLPSRPLGPEDTAGTRWSVPIPLRITG